MKTIAESDIIPIRKRASKTNKYDYGNVLIFGGSIGYFGAPALSALAAYRTGSGLVSVALEEEDYPFYLNLNPEVMIKRYLDLEEVDKLLIGKDAALFGPGLEDNLINEKILRLLLSKDIPLVIDATGLMILKRIGFTDNLKHCILTPHMGEARRLLDDEDPQAKSGVLTSLGAVVIFKDNVTSIMDDEHAFLSDRGHPGMAKAGSGDVLSGVILSLLGQGYARIEAAKLGVYLHQVAGSIAVAECGEHSLIASDIISALGKAISGSR